MNPLGGTLLIVGAVLEFVGIVALGWPDFIPWRDGLARWLTRTWRRVWAWILRRVLRRRGPAVGAFAVGDVTLAVAVSGFATTAVSGTAPLEQKVAFLLQRDQEAQKKEQGLADEIKRLDKDVDKRLDALRDEMRGEYEAKLSAASEQYRSLRILGTFILFVGLVCTTWANFV
ncbi:MAG: hypothetical protein AB7I08_12360 [Thermoleophilia bacterium]